MRADRNHNAPKNKGISGAVTGNRFTGKNAGAEMGARHSIYSSVGSEEQKIAQQPYAGPTCAALNIVLRVPFTERTRYRRAVAYLERLANASLFPNPTIEEDEFTVAYYSLEYRAQLVALRQR